MFKYNCLNPIADVGLNLFSEEYTKTDTFEDADAVLVRSAVMHDMEMPEKLAAIARAGAGVNNIPLDTCADKGIVVFNTPGANANGVKELVIAGMLMASRDIVGGINWGRDNAEDADIAKAAEKAKKAFAGSEIAGKKLGVIGLGAIGVLVANAANRLGMEVYGCDPYVSVANAWNLSRDIHHVKTREEIYAECDFITLHVPLLDDTKGMINEEAISQMKDGVVILNYARDILVDEAALAKALESGKVARYMTDFPNPTSIKMKNTIVTPHIGASTCESEDNCAVMAVNEIRDFMENGNVKNSVNYPNCDAGVCSAAGRITVAHKNKPKMLTQFTAIFSEDGINIADMTNKSRGDYSYCIFDIDSASSEELKNQLEAIDGVLKVRIIK